MCKLKPINLLIVLLFIIFGSNTLFSQSLLDPSTQEKFVNPMPVIKDAGLRVDLTSGGDHLTVQMKQTSKWLGLIDPNTNNPLMTTVWGYDFPSTGLGATYPGATIVAQKNKKVFIEWRSDELPGQFLPVDASLHLAHPEPDPADLPPTPTRSDTIQWIRDWYGEGNVPTVTHLHGGHTESESDGLPEAWFTQDGGEHGAYWKKQEYQYDNTQESATLWYHDHALGITRLNVYAGLAGFYLLRDDNENKLINQNVLPGGDYEIEIVIQDRDFYDNGQLFWPAYPNDPPNSIWDPYDDFINGEGATLPESDFPGGGATALAEFFGDYILVNGMAWPKLEVEPRKYRFRLLNGSDSRFYVLKFQNSNDETQSFLQIGTDDGLLAKPVALNQLLIAPGERMDIVVDFTGFEDGQIYLRNFGPDSPFGGFPIDEEDIADPNTTGQVMMFDVNKPFNNAIPNARVKEMTRLRQNIMPLVQEGPTRQLVLFEGSDEYGRLMPMLGTLADGSLTWSDAITENPEYKTNEVWEVYNSTGDAHPIHLHLVAFQIINREQILSYNFAEKDQLSHSGAPITGGQISDVVLSGNPREPADNEKGWKDTAVMLPGEVTRVIARFDLLGRYVWHCHILSHEDHEMMRPFEVIPKSVPKQSGDVLASVTEFSLGQNYPNPFNPSTTINFSIPQENTLTSLKIYNSLGQEVGTLLNQVIPAGNHEVQFNASALSSGVYFYVLKAGNFIDSRKMILMK